MQGISWLTEELKLLRKDSAPYG